MAGTLGTIRGQMILDVKQAIAGYTAARLAHLNTVTALKQGGAALQIAGAGIAAVGIALFAALGMAAKAAADFERKMDYAGAVTGATKSQLDALRASAIQIGQDTIYSAGQIADSFVELAKSGVKTEDIIGGIGKAVANLGAAADIPLDTAANIIMSAVQTFSLSASEAVHVADLLAGAANSSIVDVEDLGVSLKYVGGVASALSVPIEDVADALALLGTYGIKGSTAGTSLRQILVSLGGGSKAAKEELKSLGIITDDGANKFYTAEGKAKSLSEIFQVLQDATSGLTDAQKVASFRTIFQNRALAAALDLTKSGAAGFAEMNAQIGDVTALDVASKRLNNLSGDIEILRGNIETLVITQGSTIQEFLRGVVQGVTKVVQAFTNLSDGTQATILKIIGVTAVVFTVVGLFGIFAGSILRIVALISQLKDAWVLVKAALIAGKVAVLAMNTAWLASPITWIILAIVALVAAFVYLWKNNEGFRNFFISLWDSIVVAFKAVVAWFQTIPGWWDNLWSTVTSKVSSVWNGIIAFFAAIPGVIANLFFTWTLPGILISHWDAIWATIVSVWTGIIDWFQAIPERLANFFSELPGKVGYWIGFMAGTVIRILAEWAIAAWDTITIAWNAVIDWFALLPDRVATFFIDLYNKVMAWLITFGIDALLWALNTYTGIVDWFSKLPERVASFFSDLYYRVLAWLVNTYLTATQKALDIYNGIVDWIAKLPERVAKFFTDIHDTIVEKFNAAKDKAIEIGTSIYNGIRDAINSLPELVSGIFQNVIDAIKGKITSAFNAIKDFADGLWQGFKDGLGIHSPSYIEKAMWRITDVLADETVKLGSQVKAVQGLGNNLNEIGSSMGSNLGSGVEAGIADLKNQLKIAQDYQDQVAALASSASIPLAGASGVSSTSPLSQVSNILLATKPAEQQPTTVYATVEVKAEDLTSVAKIVTLFEQLPTLTRAQ